MPTLLDADTTATALEALPGWRAVDGCLQRSVEVPAGASALLRSVGQISAQMNHQAATDVHGHTVTFRLSTSSVGGISDLDVDLAARIDQVLSGSEATGTDPGHP